MALNILRSTLLWIFETEVGDAAETPELYLRLTEKCVEQVDRMTTVSIGPKFNQEQCTYLVVKLKMAVRSAQSYLELINTWYSIRASPQDLAQSVEIFKLLFALSKEVENFIRGCCKGAWIQSAISLTNVSEHISSLSFSLEICKNVFANRKILGALPSLTLTKIANIRIDEAKTAKKKANLDELRLINDLNALIQDSQPSSAECQLAAFLLERLKSERQHLGPNLQGLNQPSCFEILSRDLEQVLGKGAYGIVHKVLWMGTEVAKKSFHGPSIDAFLHEVRNLEGLRHPNIVSLLWYMRDERKCYIVMELMDSDLYSLMQKKLECGTGDSPFTISEAVHIILQVAEGVLFLHEKKIVHRDLKSHNILVKYIKARLGINYLQFKVADFGLSTTKEKSMTYTNQTQNQGTTRWMAPEMIKIANDDGQVELQAEAELKYPFKVDVYSFGMVCFEILTGDVPFYGLNPNEVKKTVLGGGRPQLPDGLPDRLRTLIMACWNSEPSRRPDFSTICAELRHLKCALFMTSAWAYARRCFNMDEIRRMTNNFSTHNLLSWGALTMVYKGVVVDTGEVVAVQRILEKYSRCPDEFKTQMELLSGLHHNNLVRYVGFCHADDETILVFEYMPNDTLDKLLLDHERKVSLTWPVRRNICLGVASGIHYLHSLAQPRIIYRHIRPSNILLDETLNPKVSFQLALSPEYETLGQGSEKVDVYSFGVVLLEIVSGKINIDPKLPENQLNLVEWARKLHSEGRSNELIDSTLDLKPFELNEAVRIIQIALQCVYRAVDTRPEMALVVAEISKLGLEHDKERSGMSNDERQVSFASSSGDFEVDLPSSILKLNDFGETEEQLAADTKEGESSDASFDGQVSKEPLESDALIGVEYLCSGYKAKVLQGFTRLIKCASLPGGPLAVLNAKYILAPPTSPASSIAIKAIPTAIKLAKTQDPQYSKLAMKLMVALTSNEGGEPDSDIILEVADYFDVFISLMREYRFTITLLLAAETVANILVNKQVRKMVRGYDGIVPAFVAFSNLDAASLNIEHLKRADDVCLKGLKRLANCEMRGDKTQMIVAALLKLLRKGLGYQPEMKSLVKDSLVALENQVKAIHHDTSTKKVCIVVWKDMLELMLNEGFASHTTVAGRMAIISIMTKLCAVYKEDINKHLFWFLLKMIKGVGSEIANLLEASQPLPHEENVTKQLRSLTELLASSVRLLRFCMTHGKDAAQSVLIVNVEGRRTLEEVIVHGGTSGIPDNSRLQILFILDQIDPTVLVRGMGILVNMSKSNDQACRQQVASKLRMLVAGKQNLTELKEAGGIDALMALLQDPNPNCQRDALVALEALPPSFPIPVDQLPFQTILDFLDKKWPTKERNAAIGLLYLMVKYKAASADIFVKTKGALEAILNLLEKDLDRPGSQKSAHALLEMAKEDLSVRRRIAEPGLRGLNILVKYVRDHAKDPSRYESKELLTATLVLFCTSGEACQEAVIKADGHVFLLTSLQEHNLKDKAAQGLLELMKYTRTREIVLEARFVPIAMNAMAIDARFACTDIALGLDCISSTPEGLNHIDSEALSVRALLNLLEHCPEPKGKGAAALVMARLYPRLNRQEDAARQLKIAEACKLFFIYLDPSDISHGKELLEALAAIAAEIKGRQMIHEEQGQATLINHLKSVNQPDIQGLMLKILAVMTSDFSENEFETRVVKNVRNSCMEHKVADMLFHLFDRSDEFNSRTENMKYALILIRNLSLSGSYVCEQLAEQGVAVPLLLCVLKRHEHPMFVVAELAVKALEKFLDDPKGKQVFLKGGGIKSVAAVLEVNSWGLCSEARNFPTIILTMVAKDPQHCKVACETIFECDILSSLNAIIYTGETSRVRWQAAVLMKLLAMYGPTKEVCSAMKAKGCLDALISLRNVQHCKEMADDVLKFVSKNSRDCKRYINGNNLSLLIIKFEGCCKIYDFFFRNM